MKSGLGGSHCETFGSRHPYVSNYPPIHPSIDYSSTDRCIAGESAASQLVVAGIQTGCVRSPRGCGCSVAVSVVDRWLHGSDLTYRISLFGCHCLVRVPIPPGATESFCSGVIDRR